ncbi:WAT1-related protein At1g43650-like [Aristolochia californica]|uniref:WAT1-related protein At1g43650-like n=1 Tax=Aristolochia californica TaxID=171875 RepID=UPI0035E129F7
MALDCTLRVLSDQRTSLAMIFVQFLYAGLALLSKAALSKGMSHLVFVAYRQAIAALALTPLAYAMERKKSPSLSFGLFCKIFLLSLFGLTLSMDLYYMALRYSSAVFASTVMNIVPVITFLVSVLFRIETIDLRAVHGQLKILGALICVGGAILLSLYRGPPLKLFNSHGSPALVGVRHEVSSGVEKTTSFQGPLLMLASFTAWSVWFIMQGEILKEYPAKLRLTTLQCILSSVQSALTALVFNRNPKTWALSWDVQLLSVLYCGIFVSGVAYWFQIWCLEKKGPLYVIIFSPLSPLITAIISALAWAEVLYSGSVLGGFLIVGGLYCVAWARSREMKNKESNDEPLDNGNEPSNASKVKLADSEKGQCTGAQT